VGGRGGEAAFKSSVTTCRAASYLQVRIYEVLKVSKKSRKWRADPANWKCDRPGSWYCPGQYPPDLPLKIRTGHKAVDYDKHSKASI
jgi:dolichyl-diphosphooligosaccharide--protein glycosyltransferase